MSILHCSRCNQCIDTDDNPEVFRELLKFEPICDECMENPRLSDIEAVSLSETHCVGSECPHWHETTENHEEHGQEQHVVCQLVEHNQDLRQCPGWETVE